jgi:hypothetical protein
LGNSHYNYTTSQRIHLSSHSLLFAPTFRALEHSYRPIFVGSNLRPPIWII